MRVALGLSGAIDAVTWLRMAEVVLLGAWGVLAVLAVRALPAWWRGWSGPDARFRAAVVALALAALLLRIAVPPLMPEIRFRLEYSYFFAPASGLADIQKYGLGWPLLVRLLVVVFGRHELLPYAANVVLGAASVVLLVAVARSLGARPWTAWWCGVALAVTPLHVRNSLTDGPFLADEVATLLALWGIARFARTRRWVWMAVAVCGVVTAAQMRTEALYVVVSGLLLAVALTPGFPWRSRAVAVAVPVTAVLLVPHLALILGAVGTEVGNRFQGTLITWDLVTRHFVVLKPSMQSWVLVLALPVGLVVRGFGWKVKLWALVGVLAMGLLVPTSHPEDTAVSIARYQLRTLPYAALLAGAGLARVAAWGPPGLTVTALLLGAGWGQRLAHRPVMMATEFAFVRAHLGLVPEGCTVVTWLSELDTTLYPPTWLSRVRGRDHTWVDLGHPIDPDGCVVYYAPALCHTHFSFPDQVEGRRWPACEAFEARWVLDPLATGSMPPDPHAPMGAPPRWPDTPMTFGLYRVGGPRPTP